MTEGITRENSLFTLVNSCKDLIGLLEQVKVVFGHRECNRVSDHLANLALDLPGGSNVLTDPPESCISLLLADVCSDHAFVTF